MAAVTDVQLVEPKEAVSVVKRMPLEADTLVLGVLLLIVSVLYSSAGQAGASGYMAAMALVGVAPAVMKPTALALNVLVASIAVYHFARVGAFSWRLFVPLSVASVPLAYIGGSVSLPGNIYNPIVGSVLIFGARRTFQTADDAAHDNRNNASIPVLVLVGATIGFLSGLTGIGGGVLLSPVLLHLRWSTARVVAGVSAAFILVNSVAGALGVASTSMQFHPLLGLWAAVVMIGGAIGSMLGSRYLRGATIQRISALLLLVAGMKMLASVLALRSSPGGPVPTC